MEEGLTKYEPGTVEVLDPERVLGEAQKAAQALTRVITSKPKKVMIRGEQYLEFEDWMTVGRFYSLTVRIDWSRPINGEIPGWEARATVLSREGREISSAEAMCLDDEENWKNRPTFMLRSMAQTRASAKAFRNVLGFVPVLAGFKATPAEEMDGVKEKGRNGEPSPEEEAGGKIYCQIKTVSEKVSDKNKKVYWQIETKEGHRCWTYDPLVSQAANDARKLDADMVMTLGAKGKIETLKVKVAE